MPAIYVVACERGQGNKIARTAIIAPILGIIANVCSWICVTAWNMEIIKPTTNAPINIGAARREAIRIASIIIETTKASVMFNNFVKV